MALEVQLTKQSVAGLAGMIHGFRIPDPTNGQFVWSAWTSWVGNSCQKKKLLIGVITPFYPMENHWGFGPNLVQVKNGPHERCGEWYLEDHGAPTWRIIPGLLSGY